MVGLVPIFVGSRGIVTRAMKLGLAAAITAGVLINPSLKSDVDPGPVEGTIVIAASEDLAISTEAVAGPTEGEEAIVSPETTRAAEAIASPSTALDAKPKPPETLRTITVEVDPTASEALERLSSLKEVATGGRQTHWRVSWILIKDRP